MPKKTLLRLEIAGPVIVFIIASFLHFIYGLSPNVLTSLFGAVNESIWEHIKIFTIAYLFYGFIELFWAKPQFKRFVVSKTAGVIIQGVFIPLAFYSFSFFVKKPVLIVDLLIGLIASVLGFLVSFKLYSSSREIEKYYLTSLMLLFLIMLSILCFTYFPPEAELFRDVITGEYGVVPESIDMGAFALSGIKNPDLL